MTYIETKKAELREKIDKAISTRANPNLVKGKLVPTNEGIQVALIIAGEFIDELLNEIESRVTKEPSSEDAESRSSYVAGKNTERRRIAEAFQHLRTGVETNPTPHTEEN